MKIENMITIIIAILTLVFVIAFSIALRSWLPIILIALGGIFYTNDSGIKTRKVK